MNETQIYQLLIGRDRRRYIITGLLGSLLIVAAAFIDTIAHQRLLAILVGLAGLPLLYDNALRRLREPLARGVASHPQSVIKVQSTPTTPLFLRFADGRALAPNITPAEAQSIIAWLQAKNPELKIDGPTFANANEPPTGSA